MTKYKPKVKNKQCVCKYCQKEFLSAEPRANICDACKVSPENTYIISSTGDMVLSRVRECFDGWTPWNMKEMKAGNNLLIVSYLDLQTYIIQRSNT